MHDYITPKPLPQIPPHLCQCGCGNPAPIAKTKKGKSVSGEGGFLPFLPFHHRKNALPEIALWRHVKPGHPSECWEWTGSCDPDGYGRTTVNYISIRTHRLSYEIHIGTIPKNMIVCHSCDNPRCCNPNHLWLGSPADNSKDMKDKGRAAKIMGAQRPQAKLSDDDIKSIRNMRLSGLSYLKIGRVYGMTRENIRKICLKKYWPHVE